MAINVRQEKPGDIGEISKVVELAFGSAAEAQLVSLIRRRDQSLLSLVATEDKKITGHVMVSRLDIEPSQAGAFGAVAPLSVLPSHQGKGIGSLQSVRGLAKYVDAFKEI